MPVYEYKCGSCGTKYDIFHRGSEVTADVVCPACNSGQHKKLMSATSVAMKQSPISARSCETGPRDAGGCCGGGSCEID